MRQALHCVDGETEASLHKKSGRPGLTASAPLSSTENCSTEMQFGPVMLGVPQPPLHPHSLPSARHCLGHQASLPSSLGSLPPPPQPLPSQQEWGWLLHGLGPSAPPPGPSPPETGCPSPPWGQHHSVLLESQGLWPAKREVGITQAGRPPVRLNSPISHTWGAYSSFFLQGIPSLSAPEVGWRGREFPGGTLPPPLGLQALSQAPLGLMELMGEPRLGPSREASYLGGLLLPTPDSASLQGETVRRAGSHPLPRPPTRPLTVSTQDRGPRTAAPLRGRRVPSLTHLNGHRVALIHQPPQWPHGLSYGLHDKEREGRRLRAQLR